jgi:23S rRNA pseudouridine1911/1915/1917 synthase
MEPPVRCDRAVVDALAAIGEEVSRVAVQRAFAEGLVRAQGRPIAPRTRVTGPLELEVTLVPARPLAAEPEALPLSVVFEDADLLAVDKPPGMVVHASAGHAHGTLVNAVLHHLGAEAEDLPVLPGNDDTRPGIVHRLDKDTSGVMVIAKHARAQARLAEQFQRHDLFRSYLGVVIGVPAWAEMRVETGHARDPADRRRFAPLAEAKRRAITEIAVHERLHAAAACTFVLHTGRTHQIRMHARHLGHPIVGDALYGPARLRDERLAEAARVLGRQALHAAELHLAHPSTGELLRLSAPLPADITRLLDALR